MRKSRVLEKLRRGQIANCLKVNLADPRVTEIAGLCGFDSVWLCMEHVPTDWHTMENQIRSAKIYNTDVFVRVSRGSYSDYIKPLEADATGIIVPHLMTAREAQDIVRQTRFHPLGRRPIDGGNADGEYCMTEMTEYINQANDQRMIIVQIEDPEPLDELDEIAKIEGIDMLFFGPGDFSHAIGAPGQMDHPDLVNARQKVAEVARENEKFAGTIGSIDNMTQLIDIGYQFVGIGADVVGLTSYCNNILGTFQKMV